MSRLSWLCEKLCKQHYDILPYNNYNPKTSSRTIYDSCLKYFPSVVAEAVAVYMTKLDWEKQTKKGRVGAADVCWSHCFKKK